MKRFPLRFIVAATAAGLAGCAYNPSASTTTFSGAPGPGGAAQTTAAARPAVEPTSGGAAMPGASPAPTSAGSASPAPPTSALTTASAPPAPPAAASASPASAEPAAGSAPGVPFSTRHAYYEPVRFADLPGWSTDDLAGAWDAFRRSCTVLGTRSGWSEPCKASGGIDARNDAAIRRFFETYFNAYQIRNVDRSGDGTMTGYYEPLLNGSRQYGGAYIYPVYGAPSDMLYLDARRVPDSLRGQLGAARIEGRTVIPLAGAAPAGARGVYTLDLRDSLPDIRDKKIRLRLDGDHIVPYYSRAEIERGAAKAPVLAYVDDPVMLYSMQLQGVGKISLRDGTIRRFAYAEQNGQPFVPPVAHAGQSGARRITVRGVDMEVDVSDDDTPSTSADAAAPRTSPDDSGGFAPATATREGDDTGAPQSPLLRGFKLAAASPSTSGSAAPAVAGAPAPGHRSFAISDPSYVFFRAIPDSQNGPTGAFGVPLSAGRSVAVDPRTTPLGAPVFVATRDDPRAPGAVDRLMMAQDSGGAIRGAVRADYFFGFGEDAQAEASRTKEHLRMWLLLPKGLHVAAQDIGLKTRGAPGASNADCVVSDPDLCVDDSTP